jgi:glycosyltransferase involved in cell wall biosynthesis
MFPEYLKVISNYRAYLTSFKEKKTEVPILKQLCLLRNFLLLTISIIRVAQIENVDLVVGGEDFQTLLVSFLSGRFSNKPWTAIFQPTSDLLQPSSTRSSINPFTVLKFVSSKHFSKDLSLYSRIGVAIELLLELTIAEESLILSVSRSVIEEVKSLNPQIKFHLINPGNGVRQEDFIQTMTRNYQYDAIFFARLIPIKGLFELPEIWKQVIKELPKAKLAVAGITENEIYVKNFLDVVNQNHLSSNIIFLGELDELSLKRSVSSSKVALYPSLIDSFSLVTLESLACGTPVVAYNIPAIAWNFGKCKAVLRCKIKDNSEMAKKTLMILENENLRAMLSQKAKEYSLNYDWKEVLKAEKNAYFKVVENFRS